MKLRYLVLFVGVIAVVGSAARWGRGSRAGVARAMGCEVYVWQRAWTGAVKESVGVHGREFGRVVVLGRQIEWEGTTARVMKIGVDWQALARCGAEVGAAVRIASFGGSFEATAETVSRTVGEMVDEARVHGVRLAEVQIDFDAAASKLNGYQVWVERCQKDAGVAVTITALPSWIGANGFEALVRAAPGYVLQVHGLEKPRDVGERLVLCDMDAARRAVERAGRIGVPFRVALPTYGYMVAFDGAGKFAGMVAEDAPAGWGAEMTLKSVGAEAGELAELVRGWGVDRPAALVGVIWYRLPVATDEMNWRWATLAAVKRGATPAAGVAEARLRGAEEGVDEIVLRNQGALDMERGLRVTVTGAVISAADALAGSVLSRRGDEWEWRSGRVSLRAGEERVIGWVRFAGAVNEQEVRVHVEEDDGGGGGGGDRGGAVPGAGGSGM